MIAAILEIIGVFIGGTVVARLVSRGLDLGPANIRSLEPGVQPDLVALSGSAAANLLLRYGFVLGLAFAVGWWHRRRPLAAYGVTKGNCSVRTHVGIALVREAFASVALALPLIAIVLVQVMLMPAFLPLTAALTLTAAVSLEWWDKRNKISRIYWVLAIARHSISFV